MKVVALRDLQRKESPLSYMREWSGTAVLQGNGREAAEPVRIRIESTPFGGPGISVEFLGRPDWPLLPLIRSAKELVKELDRGGSLP